MSRQTEAHKTLALEPIIQEYFLFFDIEVLEDYYSLTYSQYNKEPITLINPTKEELKPIIYNKVLVGYNCDGYDSLILFALLYSKELIPSQLRIINDRIINNGNKYVENFKAKYHDYSKFIYGLDDYKVRFVDLMKGANRYSLKNLDLYYNNNLQKIDFNIYKTIYKIKQDNMFEKWQAYEKNDVIFLSQLFKEKEYKTFGCSYYDLLVLYYDIIKNNKNIYYLSNIVNKVVHNMFYTKINNEKINLNDVVNDLSNENNNLIKELTLLQQKPKLIMQDDDKNKGGINFVTTGVFTGNIIDVDITSMYPNIMCRKYKLLSHFNESNFSKTLQNRIDLKKEDPTNPKVQALKIALNSTFGVLQYEDDNKGLAIELITKTGQNEILKLAIALKKEFNCTILQVATDGILAKYNDTVTTESLLTSCSLISELPIDEATVFNRVYIGKKNNYVAINDSLKIYKGKGVFKEKQGLGTILPRGHNRYYPNWLLAKTFNVDWLKDVEYITRDVKGKIFGYGEINEKMFKGINYSTVLDKESCIPSYIMAKYLYHESFPRLTETMKTLVKAGLDRSICVLKDNTVVGVGITGITLFNAGLGCDFLVVKPSNNLMCVKVKAEEFTNDFKTIVLNNKEFIVLLYDKKDIKWSTVNRKSRDKLLLDFFKEYLKTDVLSIDYGLTRNIYYELNNENFTQIQCLNTVLNEDIKSKIISCN